jgi:hypothetical protein
MSEDNRDVLELLTQLKIISMLRQHERFSTRGEIIRIENEGWMQGLRRYLYGESRECNINHLSKIFDRVFSVISIQLRERTSLQSEWFQKILEELQEAKTGITNLKTTYESDSVSKAKLDVLLGRIDTNIRIVEKRMHENKTK